MNRTTDVVNLGDQVQPGSVLCLLSNHQRLYVEGRAFKSEAGALAAAAEKKVPIKVEFADEQPGAWPAPEPLLIHHLSNQVDPATRTAARFSTARSAAKVTTCGTSQSADRPCTSTA